MPRGPRNAVITSGATYHVIVRGNDKMRVFHDKRDYESYLASLDMAAKSCGIAIHHYVLMPNHAHVLLRVDGDLPLFMQLLQAKYAKRYNKRYGHVGHVWSGRYKSPIIESDAYLFACGNYIEMNPVRAGIAVHPEDWPYSSYKAYAFGKRDPVITLDPFYPTIADTKEERQRKYRDLIGKTRRGR